MNFLDARLPDRFWSKCIPEPNSGCWLWFGANNGAAGYGQLNVGGRPSYAHRIAFIAVHAEIPDGLELDHKCRTRCCVNPAHVEPVTGAVNTLRGMSPFAKNARVTHCPRGHEYTADNIYRRRDQSLQTRDCIACRRERDAERVR